ncbi:MAG TPA: PilZ domain-containing protein [Nitrospira sp.]
MAHVQRQLDMTSELRRYPRLRVAPPFAVAFSRLGLERWLSTDRRGLGVVLDISIKGVKVMSASAMNPGDHLTMSLRLPDLPASVNVDATVRWGKDHTFGLEFVAVPQSAETRLKKFLSRTAGFPF